ncbi:PREDICTED: CMRF35-like molecule 8 [Chaetura pelagica]|uniref:CMRF35-like molecule 8 n=1 Tax=Chaetura pelagica TaxID=8897 RepID=UPI000523AEB2|nr:PREDICTED: CMRF35-like molecule 8 [Chaetura pelagica]
MEMWDCTLPWEMCQGQKGKYPGRRKYQGQQQIGQEMEMRFRCKPGKPCTCAAYAVSTSELLRRLRFLRITAYGVAETDPPSRMVRHGCWAVTGPDKVQGFLGGSLSVTCRYEPDWEMQPKFWCVPGTLYTCGKEIVITSRQQPEVRRGRFSIRDNRESREITVMVHNLTGRDSGTYVCGVRTGKASFDRSHRVEVIVSPGLYLCAPGSSIAV